MRWIVNRREAWFCALWGPMGDGSYSTVVSPEELLTEWSIGRTLKKHGKLPEIDLNNVPPELTSRLSISRDEHGWWFLGQGVRTNVRNRWGNQILDWCSKNSFPLEELAEIQSAADPIFGWDSRADARRRNATVLIPVDLRRSIDTSLSELKPALQKVQNVLFRLSGRHGVFHDTGGEDATLGVLCYLRMAKGAETSTVVGRDVYPHKNVRLAAREVRNKVSKVRKALRAHGLKP